MHASRGSGIARAFSCVAIVAGLIASAPAAGQQYSVQPSIDQSCMPHDVAFTVPAGQVARDFTAEGLDAGLACTTRTIVGDKAWGISNNANRPRAGNVYYYNHNANGSIYEEPSALRLLVLPAGRYFVHVDGGINATVRVLFRLAPAGAAAAGPPAVGPGGPAGPAGTTSTGTGGWEYVGIGDCPGNDIAGGGAGMTPNPAYCDAAHNGNAAVCWDGHTPRTMSPPGCTVKSTKAERCTGGVNPGRMYRCVFRGAATEAPPATTGARERVFVDPKVNGRHIDNCLTWGAQCQKPAADHFCRLNGFSEAASFGLVNRRPTLVMRGTAGPATKASASASRASPAWAARPGRRRVARLPRRRPQPGVGGTRVGPMLANTDMMGYDIGNLDLGSADPAACQAECLRTPNLPRLDLREAEHEDRGRARGAG